MTSLTIRRTHEAIRDDIADLTTRRPVPGPTLEHLNPFLFLNHHGPQVYPANNRGLPFGPHPHRGFETVTFILEGELAHADTGGHESIIEAGGIQWMTAGSGLVHSELSPEAFKKRGGPLEILQLWVNLPARLKMTTPRYVGLQRDEIPAVRTDDGLGEVNVISGRLGDQTGPVASLTSVFMSTVALNTGGRIRFENLGGRVVFLYVVRGSVRVGDADMRAYQLAEMNEGGDTLEFNATEDALVLFGHADPIEEPVVAHGPFVMNTTDEIHQAIADYRAGKFQVDPS
ncbi:pirin family protein [Pseudomonas sp. Marseille-QA0892]